MPISTRSLIQLCHRVGMATRSGLDARRTWETEERHANGRAREVMSLIRRQVTAGGTVAEGMQAANGYFPPMFVQMVAVGEQTGKLDEVLLRLAKHYEHLASMRRSFWMGIAWPLFELVFAVLVIGFLILILGMLAPGSEGGVDILGLGLVGFRGAVIWFLFCAFVAFAIALAVFAVFRGWLGPQPVLVAMRIPVLGGCLESLALSRLTWSLALALDAGIDAKRAATLAIASSQNPYYESSLATVTASIRANRQFYESFADGRVFPEDFIQQLEIAETTGTTTESLLRLANEYEERAKNGMRVLTAIATGVVMMIVFAVMIFAIISIAWHGLFKHLYEAVEMSNSGRV